MEMEGTILTASINNRIMNAMNITQIAEDLWYLIQSNMDDWAFQVQRMLADELDQYKGKRNSYVEENIWEIQELYIDKEEKRDDGRVEDEKVILIKPYKVSSSTSISTHSTSFIDEEIENLIKYMKFVKTPMQTRLFHPPAHYQSLKSRGEQDPNFWKEITMALVDTWHNTEMTWNGYPIKMYQENPLHEPFFITIDCRGQVIIGPNKKVVATYVSGELEVLIWFMWTWILKWEYCYNRCLLETVWTWAKGITMTISYAKVVSVSTLYSRCHNLISSSLLSHII